MAVILRVEYSCLKFETEFKPRHYVTKFFDFERFVAYKSVAYEKS